MKGTHREQHAPDLLECPEAAHEGHEEGDDPHGDDDVGGGGVDLAPQQLLQVGLVHHRPHPEHQQQNTAHLRGGEQVLGSYRSHKKKKKKKKN